MSFFSLDTYAAESTVQFTGAPMSCIKHWSTGKLHYCKKSVRASFLLEEQGGAQHFV